MKDEEDRRIRSLEPQEDASSPSLPARRSLRGADLLLRVVLPAVVALAVIATATAEVKMWTLSRQ